MRTPFLIVNEKNYLEISGDKSLKLAKAAESVAIELGVEVAVAPPLASLGLVAKSVSIPVFAQHCDAAKPGSSTGSIVPEIISSLGALGALVNHSEKRVSFETLEKIVARLKEVGLISVVCTKTPKEVSDIASIGPDFIAIEPPELIGSGIAVSKARPEVISGSVKAARRINSKVNVICGAGIVVAEDVVAALKLDSVGFLVASGIVKAPDWRAKIRELAEPLIQ